MKKKTWIYWRWKSDSGKSLSKSFLQDIVKTTNGKDVLELSDHELYTKYPHRVLSSEIEIL